MEQRAKPFENNNGTNFFEDFKEPRSKIEKSNWHLSKFLEMIQKQRSQKQERMALPDQQVRRATILNDVHEFSVGSFKYQYDETQKQVEKIYIPMFPYLYENEGFFPNKIEDISLQFKIPDNHQQLDIEDITYQNIQVVFHQKILNNLHNKYQLDIKIDNIQTFAAQEKDNETVSILIVLKKPCIVFLKDGSKKSNMRQIFSPFVFSDSDKQFLNYWNLKQVIYLEGKFDPSMSLDELCKKLQRLDQIPKLEFTQLDGVNVLQEEALFKEHEKLLETNQIFNQKISQFVIPARFAMLSLLSTKKVSIFDRTIINFMELILKRTMLNHNVRIFQQSANQFKGDYFMEQGNEEVLYEIRRIIYIIDQMCNTSYVKAQIQKYKNKPNQGGKQNILSAFEYLEKTSEDIRIEIQEENQEGNDLRLRRVYLTPTLLLFQPNAKDQTNRVLRYNAKIKDFFFRLVLVSDNMEKFKFGAVRQQELLEKMKEVMKSNLFVGGVNAKVLNYSNSQLKNHSVWMVCESKLAGIEKNSIIQSMGQFMNKEGYLKMFARIGQCFSTTKFVCKLNNEENIRSIEDIKIKKTDDIYDKEGMYTFTDGCGNISEELCDEIAQMFQLEKCSAFQVRLGGVKGVMMRKIYKDDDQERLEGRIIEVRDSQKKFECNSWDLEVIRCSTFSQGYLNRQVILLLSSLQVSDKVFLNLLQEQVSKLDAKSIIKDLVTRSSVFLRSRLNKDHQKQAKAVAADIELFFGPSKIFAPIFKGSLLYIAKQRHEAIQLQHEVKFTYFSLEHEPIFISILENMVLGLAVSLKKRARIRVNKSCVLIGVIDETGTLNEGEVFVKINKSSFEIDQAKNVIEQRFINQYEKKGMKTNAQFMYNHEDFQMSGPVMITKNPCSHPGDIRLLNAIDEDDERSSVFEDLINVIVFPSKGIRPEQHKMSGGDLDGDVYMCIWDETIINELLPENIQPPAVYKKFEADDKINKNDDIVECMAYYFQNDNLGHLSHLHLGLCDQIGINGPFTEDAKELSWYISIAVDFAKHGKSVAPEKYAYLEKKLKQWPDFMDKTDKDRKKVESNLILGQLYRAVDCKKYYKNLIKSDHELTILHQYKLSPAIIPFDNFDDSDSDDYSKRNFLRYIQHAYETIVMPANKKLRELMSEYNIAQESELYCTTLSYSLSDDNMDKFIGDPGNKDEDAVKALNQKLQAMIKQFKLIFQNAAQSQSSSYSDYAKAVYFSAYYNSKNHRIDHYVYSILWSHSTSREVALQQDTLKRFQEFWNANNVQYQSPDHVEMFERLLDLSYYKRTLKKGLESSKSRLQLMLEVKQLFSVPWIICHEYLLDFE
ncbi:rna-dependent rna polymerase [Stylonychia lemnae]|uniref:RNA-dependent RNA polymerase n=1 Tax=Stylonychia lemnae TaxID=5949 RepID=A0A078A4B4_STYLE|nr:rna-dependent rna polymerase [Stylonychia lemnae]|eukprot:CDW76328.1 rna-dependent rna polymerase [Stylonychia lemnae]